MKKLIQHFVHLNQALQKVIQAIWNVAQVNEKLNQTMLVHQQKNQLSTELNWLQY
ncbi:hypothetical protein ABID56_002029 [Alkalibacillus flavidus]|uniref:Uncharacterized protein n=2 Tax=Alkalibacillus flavidus TaxID=546021 RepID=A0ABV2KWD9_9BACI